MTVKNTLKAARTAAGDALPDVLMLAGAGAVSYGAGLVYMPAGYVVAGLFALAAGWILSRGDR